MYGVGIFCGRNANQEVVWLDVSINQRLVVNGLHAGDLYAQRGKLVR